MTSENAFEYARDDFNYPNFVQNLLKKLLNYTITKVDNSSMDSKGLSKVRFILLGLSILLMIMGAYFISAVLIGVWLFLDQVQLHLFVDRSLPSSRFKHFIEETPLMLGLTLHMLIEGHLWTGFAALVGMSGLYLLTSLQMKYDLMAINIPRLYFLRWDRMGIIFLFTLLAAWPGERAYLFIILLAWFLAALSYYDYLWIMIQLAKNKK